MRWNPKLSYKICTISKNDIGTHLTKLHPQLVEAFHFNNCPQILYLDGDNDFIN